MKILAKVMFICLTIVMESYPMETKTYGSPADAGLSSFKLPDGVVIPVPQEMNLKQLGLLFLAEQRRRANAPSAAVVPADFNVNDILRGYGRIEIDGVPYPIDTGDDLDVALKTECDKSEKPVTNAFIKKWNRTKELPVSPDVSSISFVLVYNERGEPEVFSQPNAPLGLPGLGKFGFGEFKRHLRKCLLEAAAQ